MPAIIDGSVADRSVRAWLARADLEMGAAPQEILARVVAATGQPPCGDGIGALRFWGQTGDRPTVWMAAADPVHLEARLDHLQLQCLWSGEWQDQDLQQLFDELQAALATDGDIDFIRLRSCGYLRSHSPMPTVLHSPELVNGCNPVEVLPVGSAAARYQALLSEVQMTLHDSAVNQRREEQDLRAINSLWIWGGGVAAEMSPRELPPLFADDAVLRGYWLSSASEVVSWPEGLDQCVARAPRGFVAVAPNQGATAQEYAESLSEYLRELRRMLRHSELRGLTLLFRHGLTARIRPHQVFRVWRREMPHFQTSVGE